MTDRAPASDRVEPLGDAAGIDWAYIDAHTRNFDEFAAEVEPYTLDRVAEATGLGPDAVERLAETIHGGARVSFWWTMGVNQSYQGLPGGAHRAEHHQPGADDRQHRAARVAVGNRVAPVPPRRSVRAR